MQHCDIPVVADLSIENRGNEDTGQVRVELSADPEFTEQRKWVIESLAPGERRPLIKGDLVLKYGMLRSLTESIRGTLTVSVWVDDVPQTPQQLPIEVLSFDHWPGSRILPELVAAFSLPNDRAIETVLQDAAGLLRESTGNSALDGYQSGNRQRVLAQMAAIYAAVARRDITYINPPASFRAGQKVRLPSRILDARMGTCLDLTLLFSACLEQAGLYPVLLFQSGHCWIGCWLVDTGFSADLVDDLISVRARVDSGELLSFETTVAVQGGRSFQDAVNAAREHLADDQALGFEFAIEVALARRHRITPLPSDSGKSAQAEDEPPVAKGPTAIDLDTSAIELPPLINDDLPTRDDKPLTAEGRLNRWKSRLLDLSLRNKLLNFRPTAGTLPLVVPRPDQLEDALARGDTLTFRPLPAHLQDGSVRSFDVYSARTHGDLFADTANEAFAAGQLLAGVGDDDLDRRLTKLFRDARTAEQEGGANTLFIALGMLRWKKTDTAERSHLAPLILVPVSVKRPTVRGRFKLLAHDDDTIVNPTLLQFLKRDFGMHVLDPDDLPTDESGVDVVRIWQLFRHATRDLPGWEVTQDATIGLFSFTKFLMWKDLESRTEVLKHNQTVRHLIERSGMEQPGEFPEPRTLDDTRDPATTYCPLLCDSSQLAAVFAAAENKSFVIEGPPGTGKSQTITNMIAHLAGSGKRVLFLSEKITALDVVKRRLDSIGLEPFLLELHSAKSGKAEFAKSMRSTIDLAGEGNVEQWAAKASQLRSLRDQLNDYVRVLHTRHRNGLTPFEALAGALPGTESSAAASSGWTPARFTWPTADAHDAAELEALRKLSRDLAGVAAAVGTLREHPLTSVRRIDWSPAWQQQFETACDAASGALGGLSRWLPGLQELLGIPPDALSLDDMAALDALCVAVLATSQHAPGARTASLSASRTQRTLERMQAAVDEYQDATAGVEAHLAADRLRAYNLDLTPQWAAAVATWWPKRWFAKRGVRKQLAIYTTSGKAPVEAVFTGLLAPLDTVRSARDDMEALIREVRAQDLIEADGRDLNAARRQASAASAWMAQIKTAGNRLTSGDDDASTALEQRLNRLLTQDPSLLVAGGKIGQHVTGFRVAWAQAGTALTALAEADGPDVLGHAAFAATRGGAAAATTHIARMRATTGQLRDWCGWNRYSDQARAAGLAPLIDRLLAGEATADEIPAYFEFSYRDWFARRAFDEAPALRGFLSTVQEQHIADFRALDAEFAELTKQQLFATLTAKAHCVNDVPRAEMALINHEAQKQRAHKSVRYMVRQLPQTLKRVKPIMLMSPLSVAQYLEPEAEGDDLFDVLIMDEASQIPVWDAVGAIARAKQVIVVGDTKQLPPTNFFNSAGKATLHDGGYEDLESILDECMAAGLPTMRLKWHYRSRNESLIAFSNQTYYDGELVTFPAPTTQDSAVSLRHVNGLYDRGGSRTNRIEAEAVADAIAAHYLDPTQRSLTLGVVAFSQAQEQLILDLVDARRRENPALDAECDANDAEPLMIKNLEAVQGDERDIIFFSIGYGPDAAGKLTYNMGPLNRDGGHRRLNVAITRAREQVVVFSSVRGDDLSPTRVKAQGINDLKHYLDFAEKGTRALSRIAMPTGRSFDSPFEREVAKAVRALGFEVHPQVGVSAYRIDLGVVDPQAPGRYLLGIECDGAMYHSAATARDRDRLRQMVLEGLGWTITRVWSTDWWQSPAREIDKLTAAIRATEAERDRYAAEQAEAAAQAVAQTENADTLDASHGVHVDEPVST